MIKRFLSELPLKAVLTMAQSGDEQYAKIFKKEQNYIAVSMVVVLREFQGQGFMHKVLEQPFAEADKKDIPCVLDTDTSLKVKKYIRCGMKLVAEKGLKEGISLYTMAYHASTSCTTSGTRTVRWRSPSSRRCMKSCSAGM